MARDQLVECNQIKNSSSIKVVETYISGLVDSRRRLPMAPGSRQRLEVAPLSRKRASVVVEKFNGHTQVGRSDVWWTEFRSLDRLRPLPGLRKSSLARSPEDAIY